MKWLKSLFEADPYSEIREESEWINNAIDAEFTINQAIFLYKIKDDINDIIGVNKSNAALAAASITISSMAISKS